MVSDKTVHYPIMGSQPKIQGAWVKVNKALLQSGLHHCKKVTLDIDPTEIAAAGYQTKIITYCDEHGIDYAIRAKASAAMRAQIEVVSNSDWQPFLIKFL